MNRDEREIDGRTKSFSVTSFVLSGPKYVRYKLPHHFSLPRDEQQITGSIDSLAVPPGEGCHIS
jgi:hypothetical protein